MGVLSVDVEVEDWPGMMIVVGALLVVVEPDSVTEVCACAMLALVDKLDDRNVLQNLSAMIDTVQKCCTLTLW